MDSPHKSSQLISLYSFIVSLSLPTIARVLAMEGGLDEKYSVLLQVGIDE